MKSYPDVKDDPGFDSWIRATKDGQGVVSDKREEGWSRDKVFHDISKHVFTGIDTTEARTVLSTWDKWHTWFKAHPTPEMLSFPGPIVLCDGTTTVPTEPYLSWGDMWAKIMSLAPPADGVVDAAAVEDPNLATDANFTANAMAAAAALQDTRHPNRVALAGNNTSFAYPSQ